MALKSDLQLHILHKKMQNDILNEMRSLQMARSKGMNRRDLKNQIKERDEQIAFLINHFGGNRSESHDDIAPRYSMESMGFSSSRSEALSQIEAKLTSALAPFRKENEENVDANKQKLSAYHFVPATSSSDNINKRSGSKGKKKRKERHKRDDDSLLKSIFGSSPIEQQHRGKYQRDTVSSKQKRKHNTRSRHKQHEAQSESSDDDDDVNYNEDRYKSLNRKYG
eukprot:115188_1